MDKTDIFDSSMGRVWKNYFKIITKSPKHYPQSSYKTKYFHTRPWNVNTLWLAKCAPTSLLPHTSASTQDKTHRSADIPSRNVHKQLQLSHQVCWGWEHTSSGQVRSKIGAVSTKFQISSNSWLEQTSIPTEARNKFYVI